MGYAHVSCVLGVCCSIHKIGGRAFPPQNSILRLRRIRLLRHILNLACNRHYRYSEAEAGPAAAATAARRSRVIVGFRRKRLDVHAYCYARTGCHMASSFLINGNRCFTLRTVQFLTLGQSSRCALCLPPWRCANRAFKSLTEGKTLTRHCSRSGSRPSWHELFCL